MVLAGLATPLVFSVHTTVSFDFSTSVIKGWHSTIYPPYFVAGAVFSGFAMVQTLLLIARKVCHLEDYITKYHIEIMNIVIIVTGGMVTVAYAVEYFIGWYSGSRYEDFTYLSPGAATGPYWWAFWALIICNLVIPAAFWFKPVRRNIIATFFIALFINIWYVVRAFLILSLLTYREIIYQVLGRCLSRQSLMLEYILGHLDSLESYSYSMQEHSQ